MTLGLLSSPPQTKAQPRTHVWSISILHKHITAGCACPLTTLSDREFLSLLSSSLHIQCQPDTNEPPLPCSGHRWALAHFYLQHTPTEKHLNHDADMRRTGNHSGRFTASLVSNRSCLMSLVAISTNGEASTLCVSETNRITVTVSILDTLSSYEATNSDYPKR